jgi:putative addiction module killer protein
MQIRIERTPEFNDWFEGLNLKDQLQIDSRIQRIRDHSHFGDAKNLGDGLAELRWKNGRRVYFSKTGSIIILLLNGGLKNAQKKDIQKARILLERYIND